MRFTSTLSILLIVASTSFAQDDLSQSISKVIDTPDYKGARWGLLIMDAKTGDTVYSRNADKLFAPASVTKLFSCGATLVAYGPDYKFRTPVYARGKLDDGILVGDIILVASGDPSFGGRTTKDGNMDYRNGDHTYANGSDAQLTDTNPLAGLEELARQIKESGITEIRGDVLIDDRIFRVTRSSGSGPDVVAPIAINDNCIDITFAPGAKDGDKAKITIRPESTILHPDIDVTTVAKSLVSQTMVQWIDGTHFNVRGQMPLKASPITRILPVGDPVGFARSCFVDSLRKAGVRVGAPALRSGIANFPAKDEYEKLKKIAEFESAPIGELLKVTLKVSHNLYASTLPCLIAAKKGKTTAEEGLKEQGKILKSLGVDTDQIAFGGGAGGMIADNVSPRATVQLLKGLSERKDWPQFKKWLPELGVDGTLATVVDEKSPAKGAVFAKTGTLSYNDELNGRWFLRSKSLAGAVTTKSGRELLFAFFVNDVVLPPGVNSTREGRVLAKLAEIVHAEIK